MLASISGVISTVLTLRANLDQARTPQERHAAVRTAVVLFGICAGFFVAVIALRANDPVARDILANPYCERDQMIFFMVATLLTVVPVAAYAAAVRRRLVAGRKSPGTEDDG